MDLNGIPLIYIYQSGGMLQTHINAGSDMTPQKYGLIVADLIRHVGRAYRVSEDDVFAFVKKEMDKPTTPIESLQRPEPSSFAAKDEGK